MLEKIRSCINIVMKCKTRNDLERVYANLSSHTEELVASVKQKYEIVTLKKKLEDVREMILIDINLLKEDENYFYALKTKYIQKKEKEETENKYSTIDKFFTAKE